MDFTSALQDPPMPSDQILNERILPFLQNLEMFEAIIDSKTQAIQNRAKRLANPQIRRQSTEANKVFHGMYEKAIELQTERIKSLQKYSNSRYQTVLKNDEQAISQIPRSLVPQSILHSFVSQRRNHIQRMIKHECQLHKQGKWSLQNVSPATSADGHRSLPRDEAAETVQSVQKQEPGRSKRVANQLLPRALARRRLESSETQNAEVHSQRKTHSDYGAPANPLTKSAELASSEAEITGSQVAQSQDPETQPEEEMINQQMSDPEGQELQQQVAAFKADLVLYKESKQRLHEITQQCENMPVAIYHLSRLANEREQATSEEHAVRKDILLLEAQVKQSQSVIQSNQARISNESATISHYESQISSSLKEIQTYSAHSQQLKSQVYNDSGEQYDQAKDDSELLQSLASLVQSKDEEYEDMLYESIELQSRKKERLLGVGQQLVKENTVLNKQLILQKHLLEKNQQQKGNEYLNELEAQLSELTPQLRAQHCLSICKALESKYLHVSQLQQATQLQKEQELADQRTQLECDLKYHQSQIESNKQGATLHSEENQSHIKKTQEMKQKIYQLKVQIEQAEKDESVTKDKLDAVGNEVGSAQATRDQSFAEYVEQSSHRVNEINYLIDKCQKQSQENIEKVKNAEVVKRHDPQIQLDLKELQTQHQRKLSNLQQLNQSNADKNLNVYLSELQSHKQSQQLQQLQADRLSWVVEQQMLQMNREQQDLFLDQQIDEGYDKIDTMKAEIEQCDRATKALLLVQDALKGLEEGSLLSVDTALLDQTINEINSVGEQIQQTEEGNQVLLNDLGELGRLCQNVSIAADKAEVELLGQQQAELQAVLGHGIKERAELSTVEYDQQMESLLRERLDYIELMLRSGDRGEGIDNSSKQKQLEQDRVQLKLRQEGLLQQQGLLKELSQLCQYRDSIEVSDLDQIKALRLQQVVQQISDQMKSFYNDDFDLDGQIMRKRSSECEGKRSRSNSIEQEVTAETKIQNKYKTYGLSQVEERSQEGMTEDAGSEAGFDLGRSGSTGQVGLISGTLLREKLKVVEEEIARPSIFDMQRGAQGSYRATTYDKTTLHKRVGNALKQKLNLSQTNEDVVCGDLLTCLLSGRSYLNLHSDYEMMQGFQLFEQIYNSDRKCHEAMFGLARINYTQGRYEIAEKLLIKAYETKRDFTYRVWLGFTQMQMYSKLADNNPRRLKHAQNAVSNLDRCSKEKNVALYANFGLLYLSLSLQREGLSIKGCQDPSVYASQMPSKYEQQLSACIVQLSVNSDKGLKGLKDLIQQHPNNAHGHFVLITCLLDSQKYSSAVAAAQTASTLDCDTFQERLAFLLLLCKALVKSGKPEQALLMLQMQYADAPHFNCLLYLYGKYSVQSKTLLVSGVSILQEVKRISCQVRVARACYWLAEANQSQFDVGLNQSEYLSQIRQVVKQGDVKYRPLTSPRVHVTAERLIIEQCKKYTPDIVADKRELVSPVQPLEGQSLDRDQQNGPSEPSDLFKAISLRLQNKLEQAYQLVKAQEGPEYLIEAARLLRLSLVQNQKLISIDQMIVAASKIANCVHSTQLTSDTWAKALTQAAKLYHEIAKQTNDHEMDLQAFACLMQIKQCLPVIDTSLTDAYNFGTVSRFLSEEFDHIDFQAIDNGSAPQAETTQFKPQDEYDSSNRFFIQTKFAQQKLVTCPLATLSIAEIRDQKRTKGDHVFYFGGAQTDLAYYAEQRNIQQLYYKSSTPLIAVIKYMQHLRSDLEADVEASFVQDTGFCVRSNPKFLYLITKMCCARGIFIDLAIQSLTLYAMVMSYYRNYNDWAALKTTAKLMLCNVLKKMSQEDAAVVETVTKEVIPQLQTVSERKGKLVRSQYIVQEAARLSLELK